MSRSRRSKRASVWWDELRHQPGPGGPISQPGKWVQYPKARKTGPLPLCLSLETSQECRDYKRVVDKSWPWRGVGTRKREPGHSSRLASPPAEDQPGGPRVSRARAIQQKQIKIKNYTRYQENQNQKQWCTLTPVQQQDGQTPQPAEGKVEEPCESGDQELSAPPPPPELIRKRWGPTYPRTRSHEGTKRK